MRPSSNSDPNAPYRNAIASLVDCTFLTNENAEQNEIDHTTYPHSSLAELSPRGASSSHPAHVVEDAGPSSASQVNIDTVRQYLLEKGHSNTNYLKDRIVNNRINSANLDPGTLLSALQFVYDIRRPLPEGMTVSREDRAELIYRLAAVITNKSGFYEGTKVAAQNSNNDPEKLITNFLQYMRDLNP